MAVVGEAKPKLYGRARIAVILAVGAVRSAKTDTVSDIEVATCIDVETIRWIII